MQVNNFGLQDPHRFTTVAFDSVGTRLLLVLDDGSKVKIILKSRMPPTNFLIYANPDKN
jgi:hypothetical protein